MNQVIYASAASMAQMIREKEISSVELVDAHLKRIEEVNPKLNAVVQIAGDAAMAEAGRADEALARGENKGPLHGVPMTLKDSIDTKDLSHYRGHQRAVRLRAGTGCNRRGPSPGRRGGPAWQNQHPRANPGRRVG